MNDIERRMIDGALKKYHWNKQKAAQALAAARKGKQQAKSIWAGQIKVSRP